EITSYRSMDQRMECFILLAEGERREAFTPMVPRQARVKGLIALCDYDTMPGKHVAMCGSEGNHTTPMFALIKDMVACFLCYPGFDDLIIKNDWTKLNYYSAIANGLYWLGEKGGHMNQGGFCGLAETILVETDYAKGRKFHVPDQ